MKLLGLRLCEHDSNISYFDGKVLHYFKSERKYQSKHHAYDDLNSWKKEIKELWGVDYNDLDEIAIILDPWRHNLPTDNEEFFPAIKTDVLDVNDKTKVYRINHHYAHVLSCFPIYKKRPNIEVVIDGFGDQNNSWTIFKNDKVFKRGYLDVNGSLGQSMALSGEWLGVKVNHINDYAGKVMGLQSYGNIDKQYSELLNNFDMYSVNDLFDQKYFEFILKNEILVKLRPLDYIRTVHDKVSDILIKFFEDITNKKYDTPISYSGGVAHNVIWNTKLKEKFPNLMIPPHCDDEGLSLGAIEYLRIKNKLKPMRLNNFPFSQSDERPIDEADDHTITRTIDMLKEGKIIGWYQGYGELGPRALGHRSLLIDPTIKNAKEIINKVKNRENYRPFGASVLKEHQKDYFNTDIHNPHMLYVGDTIKENLESITHVDGTCRFQTVDKSNGVFYKLLKQFYTQTGCSVLLNTSFNINGKPILGNKADTIKFLRESKIDAVVFGNKIINS